jgi:hypothetical protein
MLAKKLLNAMAAHPKPVTFGFPSEIVALCRISEGLPDAIEFEKQYIESAETANYKRDTTHLRQLH